MHMSGTPTYLMYNYMYIYIWIYCIVPLQNKVAVQQPNDQCHEARRGKCQWGGTEFWTGAKKHSSSSKSSARPATNRSNAMTRAKANAKWQTIRNARLKCSNPNKLASRIAELTPQNYVLDTGAVLTTTMPRSIVSDVTALHTAKTRSSRCWWKVKRQGKWVHLPCTLSSFLLRPYIEAKEHTQADLLAASPYHRETNHLYGSKMQRWWYRNACRIRPTNTYEHRMYEPWQKGTAAWWWWRPWARLGLCHREFIGTTSCTQRRTENRHGIAQEAWRIAVCVFRDLGITSPDEIAALACFNYRRGQNGLPIKQMRKVS